MCGPEEGTLHLSQSVEYTSQRDSSGSPGHPLREHSAESVQTEGVVQQSRLMDLQSCDQQRWQEIG